MANGWLVCMKECFRGVFPPPIPACHLYFGADFDGNRFFYFDLKEPNKFFSVPVSCNEDEDGSE